MPSLLDRIKEAQKEQPALRGTSENRATIHGGRPGALRGRPWIAQIFRAGQAAQGNIVRRSMRSVMQFASADLLRAEVVKRGFHMALIGEQYVIVCNKQGQISVIC